MVRYEYSEPGAMVHCDTKKLGRIVGGPGHRIHGDHSRENRGVGWEVMHMAIDDATRLVYAEILGDEKACTTALFLVRAVRWFRSQGIAVDRVLTDNGSPYRSNAWRRVCRIAGLRHRRTRPYHPQTNGKAERWIQTALRECLYLEVFNSSEQRLGRPGAVRPVVQPPSTSSRPQRAPAQRSPCSAAGGVSVTNVPEAYT